VVSRLEDRVKELSDAMSSQGAKKQSRIILPAENRSLAAAGLQEHLLAQLNAIGVAPSTSEITFPQPTEGLDASLVPVMLRVEMDAREGDIPAILLLVEKAIPAMMVSRLSIDRSPARKGEVAKQTEWQKLSVILTVTAWWRKNDA